MHLSARTAYAQEAGQPGQPAVEAPDARTLVVRARWLIDGISDKPRRNVQIVIRGNRIVDVLSANSPALPADEWVMRDGAVFEPH